MPNNTHNWILYGAVDMVIKLQTGEPWISIPAGHCISLFTKTSRLALGLLVVQWASRDLAPEIKWPGCDAGHSPPPKAETCISIHLFTFMAYRGTKGVRGGAAGWGTALQARFAGSIPDDITGLFQWHNPSAALCLWSRLSPWQK